jgi:hypothetical protein
MTFRVWCLYRYLVHACDLCSSSARIRIEFLLCRIQINIGYTDPCPDADAMKKKFEHFLIEADT